MWEKLFNHIEKQEYWDEIKQFLYSEKLKGTWIVPEIREIRSIFKMLAFKDVKKIIVGQDPYVGTYLDDNKKYKPYATKIAFGINKTAPKTNAVKILEASFKEAHPDKEFDVTLESYVNNGYLFINKVWSGCANKQPLSHDDTSGIKWYLFTIDILRFFSALRPDVIIYFIGNKSFINNKYYNNKFIILNSPIYIGKIKNKKKQMVEIKKLSIIWTD